MSPASWRGALAALVLGAGAAAAHEFPPPTSPDTVTTLILVRHAEKDTTRPGSDPPLSTAGLQRANLLAHALGHAEISTIFVTDWQRTRATAEPLAKSLEDTLHVLRGRDIAAHAERVRREARGGTGLVVGHSNTLPEMITALTGKPVPPIRDDEYDRLYVVVLYPGGSKIMWFNYGEPPATKSSTP